jgi:septal ring factor EnvC (AmiA/AmiB activator)
MIGARQIQTAHHLDNPSPYIYIVAPVTGPMMPDDFEGALQRQLAPVQQDIAAIRRDVSDTRQDVATLQRKLAGIQTRVAGLPLIGRAVEALRHDARQIRAAVMISPPYR